ncbi:MAG: hypothetical protein AABW63_01520 [Nanoarchaeota archaeon]
MNKLYLFLAMGLLSTSIVSAVQVCQTYDVFSSGSLDSGKWEVRQDVEGQPLTDEYGIDPVLENFHIQQNELSDKRTYLFPTRTFTTGDVLEYDFDAVSKEGVPGQMTLLTGDQYIRIGIMGDVVNELGDYHIKIEFQENNLHLERITPSNTTLIDNLALSNANGTYELYIGAYSGSNGGVHIDLDNFYICHEQTLEERVAELEQRVDVLENRTSILESLVDSIVNFLKSLPKGFSR